MASPGVGSVRLGVPGDLLVADAPADEPRALAVTQGELVWDESTGDLDWGCHHRVVQGSARSRLPRGAAVVDLRWAREQADTLSPGRPAPAGCRGRPGRGDPARAQGHPHRGAHPARRRTCVRAIAVAAALVGPAGLSLVAGFIAKGQRDRAYQEKLVATVGLLASTAVSLTSSHPDLAQLFRCPCYPDSIPVTRRPGAALLRPPCRPNPQVQQLHSRPPGRSRCIAVAPGGRHGRGPGPGRMGARLEPVPPSRRSTLRPDDRSR